jgi:AraC-like DNA-binding protein
MKGFYETRSYKYSIPIYISLTKGFEFLAHWHSDIELIYLVDGQIKVGINKESRILRTGDLAICSSGDIHYYDCVDSDSKIFLLIFKPEIIDSFTMWPQKLYFTSPFIESEFLKNEGIALRVFEILSSLNSEFKLGSTFSTYFIKALIFELCGIILTHVPSQQIQKIKESNHNSTLNIMRQALLYLENNYTQDIHLEDIAKIVNMSTFYFSRTFNQITGMNFKVYLNSIRIKKAEEMLLSDVGNSITNIAFESGFSSLRTFNRVFKSINGNIPSSIRNIW